MYLVVRIMRFLREVKERALKSNQCSVRCIILDMSAVAVIDASGLDALEEVFCFIQCWYVQLQQGDFSRRKHIIFSCSKNNVSTVFWRQGMMWRKNQKAITR